MSQRLQRLADQIQRTLSVLIRDEINDPRLTGFVTISSVKVSPDLGYADVYVTILEPSKNGDTDGGMNIDAHRESLQVLKNASGFLRTELSATMKTRTTPRLRFHYDEVTAHGNHMMNLVNEAMKKTGESSANDVDNS
ncbi:ribosome-binding factor A [Moraxella bovis]|uniref:Ribosome-binding factor A n=1 Tax=Moraxella bovis TaxID=476 RepID=A0A1T0A007_MORBO|nr:ribosome-binding factor A [Moraxella bovis]AWY21451.1 ribosome-binding factor A [Moraxella bovis]OOR89092.1 ribosome-binding factor A [Moraxella bovis]UYZ68414.1 ribosome-binding factor A [Moraxella bovis]UYZ70787.1 ribosome-binding factor A [Moraxella bovis]UYZ73281.1 ribosome-binding factor A [Moraxella bovis]